MGQLSADSVELLAILRACQLCASQLILTAKNIVIISDSSSVVSWVNDTGVGNLYHLDYIMEIRQWKSSLGNLSVIFNSRVTNSLADSLAKRAVDHKEDRLDWSLD